MEPESPSPYPQVPATCRYPQPTPSSPHDPPPTSWRSILILSSHLCLGLPNCLFPSGFPTNTLCTSLSSLIRATCPAHLTHLDFTTRTILGKEYRSFSSSLCSFLHSPVTSSLLGYCCLYLMKSTASSGTLVQFTLTTWHHIPGDRTLHNQNHDK